MFLYWWVWILFIVYVSAVVLFLRMFEKKSYQAESNEIGLEKFQNVSLPLRELFLGIALPLLLIPASGYIYYFSLLKMPWNLDYINFFMLVLADLGLFLYALTICKKRELWPLFHSISLIKAPSMLFKAFVIASVTKFFVAVTSVLLEWIFKLELQRPDYSGLVTSAPNGLLAVFLVVEGFTITAVLEELYFRGFLYNALKTRLPILAAAVLQAIIFAAAHGAGFWFGSLYFLFGVVLAAVYERKRELVSPILVHGFINAITLVPILIMTLQNFHTPASNWEEAQTTPDWIESTLPDWIERKEDGIKQWQYAIDTWGSKGSKRWKKEANAFKAVCTWFPEERTACAKAKIGMISIYLYYLKDYRRAVMEADHLVSEFPGQIEQVETALSKRGIAYLMLQDLEKSRQSFEKVINEFNQYEKPREEAEKGIMWLDRIEGKEQSVQ